MISKINNESLQGRLSKRQVRIVLSSCKHDWNMFYYITVKATNWAPLSMNSFDISA